MLPGKVLALTLVCFASVNSEVGKASAPRSLRTPATSRGIIGVAQVKQAFRPVAGLVGPLENLDLRLPPSENRDWSYDKHGFPVVSITAYRSASIAHRESVLARSGRTHPFVPCAGCKPRTIVCLGCRTLRVKNVLLTFMRAPTAASRLSLAQRSALRSDLAKLGTPSSP